MDTLWKDICYSIRTLRKAPAFTVVAVVTLALGIGANTAVFSVVKGVLLEPLPYREPDQLVQLYEMRLQQGRVRRNVVSAPDYADWRKQNTVFESMAALTGRTFTLAGEGGPELIRAVAVSPNFFRCLESGRD